MSSPEPLNLPRSGTQFGVFFPKPWPLTEATNLQTSSPEPGLTLSLRTTPEGVITAALFSHADQSTLCVASPPCTFSGEAKLLLTVTWVEGESLILEVNGHNAADAAASGVLAFETAALEHVTVFESEMALKSCEGEVAQRAVRYAPKAKPGRARTLSLAEERDRLANAMLALGEDVEQVRTGSLHRVSSIRGALRELVVFLGSESYQPALFRFASMIGAPLPICASPPGMIKDLDRESPSKPAWHLAFRIETTVFEPGRFVDLEAWMREPILRDRGGAVVSTYSMAEFIAKAAENLGGAHAGPNVPLTIYAADQQSIQGVTLATHIVLRLAEVVLEVGSFLLAWKGNEGAS